MAAHRCGDSLCKDCGRFDYIINPADIDCDIDAIIPMILQDGTQNPEYCHPGNSVIPTNIVETEISSIMKLTAAQVVPTTLNVELPTIEPDTAVIRNSGIENEFMIVTNADIVEEKIPTKGRSQQLYTIRTIKMAELNENWPPASTARTSPSLEGRKSATLEPIKEVAEPILSATSINKRMQYIRLIIEKPEKLRPTHRLLEKTHTSKKHADYFNPMWEAFYKVCNIDFAETLKDIEKEIAITHNLVKKLIDDAEPEFCAVYTAQYCAFGDNLRSASKIKEYTQVATLNQWADINIIFYSYYIHIILQINEDKLE